MSEPVYEVAWPLGKLAYETVSLANPAADLSGKTVCELWDRLFRGDEMFQGVREALSRKYPGIKFVDSTNFGDTVGLKRQEVIAALPEKLRGLGCNAVISAVGA
ncbi:MAG: hypothetical protein HYX92_09575 [Chloroflexi bacterium]|nr:hypothetical protein [Chloroflexota bacterium]